MTYPLSKKILACWGGGDGVKGNYGEGNEGLLHKEGILRSVICGRVILCWLGHNWPHWLKPLRGKHVKLPNVPAWWNKPDYSCAFIILDTGFFICNNKYNYSVCGPSYIIELKYIIKLVSLHRNWVSTMQSKYEVNIRILEHSNALLLRNVSTWRIFIFGSNYFSRFLV